MYLVDVGMDKGNIVIAGDTVAQRVEALVYTLDHHLIWKAVPHMHELCTSAEHGQIWESRRTTFDAGLHPAAQEYCCTMWIYREPQANEGKQACKMQEQEHSCSLTLICCCVGKK